MTFRYGFYNSQNHDRMYNADDMNDFLDGIISEGIIRGYKNELQPQLTSSKNKVRVLPGKAWILKTWNIVDSVHEVTLDAADPTRVRYDLLVIRVDRTARTNDIRIIKGTPGKPYDLAVLKNTSTVKDYLLAIVNVTSGNHKNILYDRRERSGYSIIRGLNEPVSLGSEVTAEQSAALRDGDFTMFPLGSYWIDEEDEVGVVKWRVVHHDYVNKALVLLPSKALWSNAKKTIDYSNIDSFLKRRTDPPAMFTKYAYIFELKYIKYMQKQGVVVDNAYYPVTKTFSEISTCFRFPSATALGSTAYIGSIYTSADRNYLDYDRLQYCWEHPEVLLLENLPPYYSGDEGIVYLNEYVNTLNEDGGNYVSSYYLTNDSIVFGTSSLVNSKLYALPYIVIHG